MNKVKLRAFKDQDLSLFKQWLNKEHVAQWYTEPDDWIYEIEKRNDEFNWLHHFIVEVEGVAIGFCQYYDYALSGETWHNRADVKEAYSIDYMIGEEKYLGKGFGTGIVFALAEEVKANTDAKKIIVQPDSKNQISRNTLLAANFQYDEENDVYYKELLSNNM
ncbi:MAG: acetyltransferase [Cellulosilyticum sp.]|nr:acetyltransferase [Cellulosilyticum sp.]